MNLPRIWVDADSCPRIVRDYIIRYSGRLKLPVFFVANRIIPADSDSPLLKMIVCTAEKGAADNYIANNAEPNDLIITRDIPFAARLVEKKISVMNDRGLLFTSENIAERLSERDFSLQLAEIGLAGNKKYSYSKKNFENFANAFDREIHKLIK